MNAEQLKTLKELVNTITPEVSKAPIIRVAKFKPPGSSINWRVTHKGNIVSFGCGAVKVNKKDLAIVGNYLELEAKYKKSMENLLKGWRNSNSSVTEIHIRAIGAKKLKDLSK